MYEGAKKRSVIVEEDGEERADEGEEGGTCDEEKGAQGC